MPAERGANAGEELFNAERFGDVIVGSGIEGDDLVAFRAANRQHNDWSVRDASDFATGLNATHTGKIHIEKNQIRLDPADEIHSFFARGNFDDGIATKRERGTQDTPNLRFVI